MPLLKIGVFGSQPFTVTQLESLQEHAGIEIRCIVAPKGIGQQNTVRQWTHQNECRHLLRMPAAPGEMHFLETLSNLQLDTIVAAGFPQQIPAVVIAMAKYGGVNVHPSALPRWRGPDPIRRAILAGDTHIGCTIHKLTGELDTGDIYWQKLLPIQPTETAGDLVTKTGHELASMLPGMLREIAAGTLTASPQSGESSYAAQVTPEELAVTADLSSAEVQRRISASSPYCRPRWEESGVSYEILADANQCQLPDAQTVEINLQDGVHRFLCQTSDERALRTA